MHRLLSGPLLVALLAPSAAAQEPGGIPGAAPERATLHGRLQLSVQEAIAMGLRNNLDVEVARHDPLIAWEDFRVAWGAYDPESFAEFGYESRETPVASSLQPELTQLVDRRTGGQSGIRGLIPWINTGYALIYDGNRATTTSQIADLSPEYRAAVAATITQPLLRDLIWSDSWTRIKTSRLGHDVSVEDFSRQVMDTVEQIERSYWQVVATQEQLRVAEKSLEATRALLDQTKTQYEVGVVSRVEVVEAEAGVAEREVNLIRAENLYRTSQDELLNLILGRSLTPGSRLEVDPTDRPQDYVVYEVDLDEATRKAFSFRPELSAARRLIETRQIELKFAKNQRLPRLDLQGELGWQGLSGRTNPTDTIFPAPAGGIDCDGDGIVDIPAGSRTRCPVTSVGPRLKHADDVFLDDDPQFWSIRGLLSIPLGNVAGRHRVSRADVSLRRARTELVRLEQRIILDVRRAARDLTSAQEGIEAAERRRLAAEEQLRAERIRLEQGESTPFDVLLREEDLTEAESEKINALRVYRESTVRLDREQGTILRNRNVVIDEVGELR